MSAKSLRRLIRMPVTAKRLWSTVNLAFEARDPAALRSAVITSAALLDVGLERLIKSRMRRIDTADDASIFGAIGILSGFSAKIRVAYAFGIIGPRTRHDLAALNDIRNVFAHAPHKITMADDGLWQKVESLHGLGFYRQKGAALDRSVRGRSDIKFRSEMLIEAITGYALMLCTGRYKRVMLPPTRGKQYSWTSKNSLRF